MKEQMPVTRMSSVEPLSLAVALLAIASGCVDTEREFCARGIRYSRLERKHPRPLRIHVLRIDLKEPGLAPCIDVGPDPDGAGSAETTLALPLVHAQRGRFLAGVNANAWDMVPPTPNGERPRYVPDAACNICGWALVSGVEHSLPQSGYWSFWLDRNLEPHVGNIATPAPGAHWAVSGFGGLLQGGKVLPGPSDVLHPRTALGVDGRGRYLTLAVVDGRRPGYSEGLSERELAELMRELGCSDALNLDGGGSSVMVLRDRSGALRIANRPSDLSGPRPIPILFGVRSNP